MADPAAIIASDPPFVRLTLDRSAGVTIELNAFAIVSVEPDPGWAHRYVTEKPAAIKRAMRAAMMVREADREVAPVVIAPDPDAEWTKFFKRQGRG